MADTAPEIKVTLTAEDRGVAAAIKELGNQLTQLKQKQQEVAESSLNLKSAFDAVISSAIILKIAEFGKQVFETSLNIDRLSQKTGLSAGFLSTFSKAAEDSGVTTEQVSVSLGRLATNITKFQQGGTGAAAAFKALNITQADFKNLSPDEKIRLVTDRLGAMQNGLQKAAIAQTIMGRGGQALIPTLNALAGDGFDRVTAAAKATGQYISDDMQANTLAAAASMNELAGAAKGAANQFEAGLEPALIDISKGLKDALASDGASGFEKLGEKAGTVLRYIALLFVDIGTTVGGVVATIEEVFDQMWRKVQDGGQAVAKAFSAGTFKGAFDALIDGAAHAVVTSKDDSDRLVTIWATTGEQLAKNFTQLLPSDDELKKRQADRTAQYKPKGGGGDSDNIDDSKADKAKLAALEARLQEELALFKANNSAEESANQIAYNQGLESASAFFAKKKQLAKAESDEQISILGQERAALAASPTDGSDAANIAKKQKIAKLDSEIAIAKVNETKTQAELDSQLFLAEEAHQKTVLNYQGQILAAQGLTYEAAIAKIQSEEAEVRRALTQAGLTPEAVAAMVAQIQQLKLATAAYDEDKKQGADAFKSLGNAQNDINLQVTAGLETQYGAEKRIAQLELARIPQLQAIAVAMRAAAVDPQQIQEAEDYAQKVKDISVSATLAASDMQQFGKEARTAIQGDLNTFLSSTIESATSVGDAFRKLATSVVESIQKIVTQLLVQIAMTRMLKMIQGAGGGGAAGPGAGGGFSEMFAAGGLVTGPGTSTSDSIPARLSAGEFVLSAKATEAIGVHTLAQVNRGVTVPAISGLGVAHFAEGGLVQAPGGGPGMDLHLGIGLDEGLVLKHLSSKAAGKVVVQHLSNNPKAANKALQRGK